VAEDFGAQPLVASSTRDALRAVATGFYAVVGVLAVAGGVVLLRRRHHGRALFLIVGGLAQLISPLATFGDPRFKMPLYPTLAVCAAAAIVALWEAAVRTGAAPPAAGGDGGTDPSGDGGAGERSPEVSPATA
jgi:hypothetical protein